MVTMITTSTNHFRSNQHGQTNGGENARNDHYDYDAGHLWRRETDIKLLLELGGSWTMQVEIQKPNFQVSF